MAEVAKNGSRVGRYLRIVKVRSSHPAWSALEFDVVKYHRAGEQADSRIVMHVLKYEQSTKIV